VALNVSDSNPEVSIAFVVITPGVEPPRMRAPYVPVYTLPVAVNRPSPFENSSA
jgi:hypothetical protein